MANAITPNLLVQGNSGTDATSYTTAATPTLVSGTVVTAWVATLISAGTPNTPTCTGTNGLNGTWTAITNVVQDQIKLTLFRSTTTSTTAGTLTFDLSGQTNSAAGWNIVAWDNVATTINAQSTTGVANGGTAPTFSALSAFGAGFNATYVAMAAAGSFLTTRGNNTQGLMLQIPQASISNGEISGADFFSPGEVNSPSVGVSGAGSDIVAIAIEVAHDGTGVSSGGGADTFIPTFRV